MQKVNDKYKNFRLRPNLVCYQFPAPDLAKLDDPEFYKQADKALTDGSPKHFYVNSPWATRLFFWLLDKLPSAWGDRARIAIMMLPK